MSGFFRALSIRNYRLWFFGVTLSFMATWVVVTTLSWVALTILSDGDALFAGVTAVLVFAPALFLVGVTGLVVDRSDRRKLLILTHSSMAIISFALALLLLTGSDSLPLFFALTLAFGVTVAFDQPARHSLVLDLVPAPLIQNAVALNTTSYNIARLVAPAVAGLLMIFMNPGYVLIVATVMVLCTIVAILRMRTDDLQPRPSTVRDRSLFEGFRYLLRNPTLFIVIMVTFPVAMLAMNFALISSTMAVHFGEDSDGFGLLSSFYGAGAIIGALLAGRRAIAEPTFVMLATLASGVMIGIGGFTPGFWSFAVSLIVLGVCSATVFSTGNAMVQVGAAPGVRGRVIALYLALTAGAGPATAPLLGWVINTWGAPSALWLIAITTIVVTGIGWFWHRSIRAAEQDHGV